MGPTLDPSIGLCNSPRLSSSLPSGHPIRLRDLFLNHPDQDGLHRPSRFAQQSTELTCWG